MLAGQFYSTTYSIEWPGLPFVEKILPSENTILLWRKNPLLDNGSVNIA
jgi:hypothetical protein